MTNTNIKDAAKKLYNTEIEGKLSVKLDHKDEYYLKMVIEDAIRLGLNKK